MKRRWLVLLLFAVQAQACGDDGGSSGRPDGGSACTTADDCAEGEICVDDRCIDASCATDDDCGDARRVCDLETSTCELREGFADECDAERPCEFGEFCSELLGRCFDNLAARDCVRRSDCPTNQICDRAVSKCVPDPGCFGPEFCEEGEVCDPVSRACEVDLARPCTPCDAELQCTGGLDCDPDTVACLPDGIDSPCLAGEFCGVLGACVECQVSADCGTGLFCNVSLGRCESTLQCADDPTDCPVDPEIQCVVCDRPLTCNRRNNRCEAPPEPCQFDTDCPEDERCDRSLDPPVCVLRLAECLNDVFDENADNGSPARATPIESGAFEDLALCPGDVDWYAFSVEAGTVLTVDTRFTHGDGDIDIELFLEDGTTLVAAGRSATDNERIRVELGTDRELRLRVAVARPIIAATTYALLLEESEGEVCLDDPLEPNDDRGEATRLEGTIDGVLCPADPDWFRIPSVPAGASIRLDLDFVPTLGDLDLEVFRPDEPQPLLVSRSRTTTESLDVPMPFGGDLFVRVSGRQSDRNSYTLRTRIRPDDPDAQCRDDVWESNDSGLTAAEVTFPFDDSLTLCRGDEDLFQVPFPGNGGVVAIEVSHPSGVDLDAALYPDADNVLEETALAVGRGVGAREYFTYTSFESEPLILRVFGATERDFGPYDVRVVIEDSFICQPDAFDEAGIGNDIDDPIPGGLAPLRLDEQRLCSPTDEDFIQVVFTGGFTYTVALQWRRPNTDLSFQLLDVAGGDTGLTGVTRGNTHSASFNVDGVGTVELIVKPQLEAGFASDYALVIDASPLFACDPDVFDPNQNASEAALLTDFPVVERDLSLCPTQRTLVDPEDPFSPDVGDEDWYRIDMVPGQSLEAEIRFDQSDLLLEIVDGSGTERACSNTGEQRCFSDGSGPSERVSFTATSTDAYFLRVSSVFSSSGIPRPADADTSYELDIERSGP